MRDTSALADVVVMTVKAALAPVLERLAAAEARVAGLHAIDAAVEGLRDRVVVMETKSAIPFQPDPALGTILERLSGLQNQDVGALADLTREISQIRERVAVVEARQPIPGPPGVDGKDGRDGKDATAEGIVDLTKEVSLIRERVGIVEVRAQIPGPPGADGKDGKDGAPGLDGKDGLAGLSYEGVYQEGQTYQKGMLSTWGGSTWHCNEETATRPGESKAWSLMVKRGRDGKDGKDAETLPIVKVGA